MHQCYGFLYIQNTCFISNYLLLCESNFSFKIRNCLLCVFYFIIHFDPRTKQKTHLKRKLNNFFQNRKIQAKKQLLKFQFTCDFTLKWRNETYETVTFQCFPLFFSLSSSTFFSVRCRRKLSGWQTTKRWWRPTAEASTLLECIVEHVKENLPIIIMKKKKQQQNKR